VVAVAVWLEQVQEGQATVLEALVLQVLLLEVL
jgi:hypothetical protein